MKNSQERKAYQARVVRQTMLWANGRPMHNATDNECCPDFSCCHPDLFTQDQGERCKVFTSLINRYKAERPEPPAPAPRAERKGVIRRPQS